MTASSARELAARLRPRKPLEFGNVIPVSAEERDAVVSELERLADLEAAMEEMCFAKTCTWGELPDGA